MSHDSVYVPMLTQLAIVALVGLVSYRAWRAHVARKVRRPAPCLSHTLLTELQEDELYGVQQGCGSPRRWAAHWPQGLDLLWAVSQHARKQTILQFFLEIIESSGVTHEQQLRMIAQSASQKCLND